MKIRTKLSIIPAVVLMAVPVLADLAQGAMTKLDVTGRELPDDAPAWAMVKDTDTDLTWEVKSDDNSIHDKDNTYSWKEHKKEFIDKLNEKKFGGFDDWRLPEETELKNLVILDKNPPRIDEKYFPHTAPNIHLSWALCQDGSINVSKINFGPKSPKRQRSFSVRGVRGKLQE
jgi:hypothetical protein